MDAPLESLDERQLGHNGPLGHPQRNVGRSDRGIIDTRYKTGGSFADRHRVMHEFTNHIQLAHIFATQNTRDVAKGEQITLLVHDVGHAPLTYLEPVHKIPDEFQVHFCQERSLKITEGVRGRNRQNYHWLTGQFIDVGRANIPVTLPDLGKQIRLDPSQELLSRRL